MSGRRNRSNESVRVTNHVTNGLIQSHIASAKITKTLQIRMYESALKPLTNPILRRRRDAAAVAQTLRLGC